MGSVVLATGGFGADFSPEGILARVRPDLASFPTTNGEHCTGDGIKMAEAIGATCVDLESVQVHPWDARRGRQRAPPRPASVGGCGACRGRAPWASVNGLGSRSEAVGTGRCGLKRYRR